MEPNAFHLVMRLRNDRVIAPTLTERRLLARTLLHVGRNFELLGFGLPDNHLHPVVAEAESRAREFSRRAEIALTRRLRLPVGFVPAHLEPIYSARHLHNSLRYAIRQSRHHGTGGDPDLEGTNLPDLLGLRPMGRYTADVVRRWLPRVGRDELLSWIDLEQLHPAIGPAMELDRAAEAALARTSLQGSDRAIIAVRRAIIRIAEATLTDREIGSLLGVSERTIRRLRAREVDEAWIRILGLQLAWLHRPGRVPQTSGPYSQPSDDSTSSSWINDTRVA